MTDVLGLDIGGANLKAAHTRKVARTVPFALWMDPRGLANALRSLIAGILPFDILAITMTGELCDCFANKREGVQAILTSVAEVAGSISVRIWTTRGDFLSLEKAFHDTQRVAAANWLAAATLSGKYAPEGAALFVDVGSTTTDIVPLWQGNPVPTGRTDVDRLKSGELVYTGVRRTPVCSLLSSGVAAELFATTLDAYLLLGFVPEDAEDCNTADGSPATKHWAHVRLARMLGGDGESVGEQETMALAQEVMDRQVERISQAAVLVARRLEFNEKVRDPLSPRTRGERDGVRGDSTPRENSAFLQATCTPSPLPLSPEYRGEGEQRFFDDTQNFPLSTQPQTAILAGSGEFLARAVCAKLGLPAILLVNLLSPALSEAVCAYAVALLAQQTNAVVP